MRTAVIGCGQISDIYLSNLINRYENTEVVCCASKGIASAKRQADKYGIKSCTVDEVLQDDSIELVVILTPAGTHYELIKNCLMAGKHVYSEKVLATTYEEAEELVALAEEKNLALGCAPDTFLGVPFRTILKLVGDGEIGEITGVSIAHNRNVSIMYDLFPILLQPGGDMASDFGPYYLTALLQLLGPVSHVSGMERVSRPNRIHADGEAYVVENANTVSASFEFKNGVLASFFLAGDSISPEEPQFTIYGTKGVIYAPDMNCFDGKVILQKTSGCLEEEGELIEAELVQGELCNLRGIGVDEIADAIKSGRRPLADGRIACHVVEIIEGIRKSSREHIVYKMQSEF